MTESKFVGAFWVLLCFIPAVMAHVNGGSYECTPAYSWTEGENVTIKFRIDRSKFPSECAGAPNGRAFFQSSPDGVMAYSTKCQLPDDIQASCPSSSSNHPCRCTNSNDNGFFVIEYNFVATANIDRWWRADIACQLVPSLDPALHFTSTGCLNGITIVTPTTSAPTTLPPEPDTSTVTESTNSPVPSNNTIPSTTPISPAATTENPKPDCWDKACYSQKDVTKYVGIGFAGLVVVNLCAVGVFLFCRYQRRKRRNTDKTDKKAVNNDKFQNGTFNSQATTGNCETHM